MSNSEVDTSRTVVQTYVPAYQRDRWDEHATELGMNRSEFVRTMVQAGRRGFTGEDSELNTTDGQHTSDSQEASSNQHNTDGSGGPTQRPQDTDTDSSIASQSLKPRVVAALANAECLSWDELLAEVTDDVETRLEETLQRLQEENSIRYSGPRGGYVLEEGAT